MATRQSNHTTDAIQQAHEQFSEVLSRQAEQIDQLRHGLESLQNEQKQLEEVASHMIEPLTRSLASDGAVSAVSPSGTLASVRKLVAATDVEQIFEALAEEAGRMSGRAAVLRVLGRAAWGSSASGFGQALSGKAVRTLVVPLNHDGPFRQVFERAVTVEARGIDLMKNPNVVLKVAPASNARVVLLPVRSADTVAAILYAETGEKRDPGLIDSLKVLAEFAGAQIDRLTIVHGGLAPRVEPALATEEVGRRSEQPEGDEIRAAKPELSASVKIPNFLAPNTVCAEPPGPPSEAVPVLTASPEVKQPDEEHQAVTEALSVTLSTEEEEKIHRDAKRFSKLLVSEIELYNKSSVEEGRRNKDLYQRLKKDIDRSRETYEKRFARTVASKVDYFHEEVVRTLAENDPMLLGPGYPGSSV